MCNELSSIFVYLPDTGELRMIPGDVTRHHAAMIARANLREGIARQNFVRTEYTPKDGDWLDCEFRIDESNVPSWVTDEIRDRMIQMSAEFRDRLIVKGDSPTMLGGKYIVTDERTVQWADNCVILVNKTAKLTIETIGDVVFGHVYGTASLKVGDVSGTASLKVGDVYGTASIGDVYGTASLKVGDVFGTASLKVGHVSGTASIGDVSGTASIGHVSGTASIGNVSGTASIGNIDADATIKTGKNTTRPIVCIGTDARKASK